MAADHSQRIIRGISVTGLGTAYIAITGFVCLIIVARAVPKDQFGVYVIMQVIAAFFLMISSLTMESTAVTKLIASAEKETRATLANAALSYRTVIDLFICVVIYLSHPIHIHLFKSEQLRPLMVYVSLMYLTSSLHNLLMKIMQGYQDYRRMGLSQFVSGTSRVLMIGLFVAWMKLEIMGAIYATILSSSAAILYLYITKPFKGVFKFDSTTFQKIFSFGLPLGLNNALSFAFTKIDRFIIAATMNPISVAYYEVAAKIPDNSRIMYQSFQSVYFPTMSELYSSKNHREAESILNNSLRIVSFVTVFLALAAYLFQEDIIRLIFTAKYMSSAPVFPILMLSLSVALVGNILGTTLVAMGHSDKPARINILDATVNIISNLLLIPALGFLGAAYAALLSRCLSNPVNVWFLKRENMRVQVSQYMKPLAAYVICVVFFETVRNDSILYRGVMLTIYVLLCHVVGVISLQDMKIVVKEMKSAKGRLIKVMTRA